MQQSLQTLNNFPGQTECWIFWQKSPRPRQGLTSRPSSRLDQGSAGRWWRSSQCFPPRHTLTTPRQKRIYCLVDLIINNKINDLLIVSHLSLLVDPNNSRGGFMRGGHKDGLCTDSVHVDAHSRLQVIQVNVTVLCDQIYYTVLTANLRRMIRERDFKYSAITTQNLWSSRGQSSPASLQESLSGPLEGRTHPLLS